MKKGYPNNTTKKGSSQGVLRVAELFAGVGGFRLGLEKTRGYKVVWSNQWEPATKKQHASEVYVSRFGPEGHTNIDIGEAKAKDIPPHDILVGGFPCQDYSVARNLGDATGIVGKKGVLWWQIHRLLKQKGSERPNYLMLENVDRLLVSPASQRGRDFAIILASLNDLGYIAEWRIINAGEYGMPQRRRRIFILAYKKSSKVHREISELRSPLKWLTEKGILAEAFPVNVAPMKIFETSHDFMIEGDLPFITENFNKKKPSRSPFLNAGMAISRKIYTLRTTPNYKGKKILLKDILQPEKDVPEEFYINGELKRWKYLKGPKNESRKGRNGYKFTYTEGGIAFPDPLDKPSRTIITGEGGKTPSRFKHVIKTPSGRLRRLTPIELERLCMFPDNHTAGHADVKRAFFMGNALVVGIVEKLGRQLLKHIK